MIRTIAGTARISTTIIKDGSVAGRDAYCKKLENKFFNKIEKYKRSQFDYIGKNLKEILPTKIIQVEKYPQNENIYNGAVVLGCEVKKTIPADVVGYIVMLKTGTKKNHFGGVSIEVLMHEIHHLFSYFTHPKVPSRIFKVSKLPTENNFEKFFVENFQSPLSPTKCKEQTQKMLEQEKEHQIDILQHIRYKLMDEIGAYRSGEEYAHLHRMKHSKTPEIQTDSQIQVLFLRDKLADITEMLKSVLKKERDIIHKNIMADIN